MDLILNDFLLKFPGIVLESKKDNICVFRGSVKNKWFRLTVSCPNFPQLDRSTLQVEHSLKVYKFSDEILKLNQIFDVFQLLENLPKLLDEKSNCTTNSPHEHVNAHLINSHNTHTLAMGEAFVNAYSDIAKVYAGEYVVSVNEKLTHVKLTDFVGFEHHHFEAVRKHDNCIFRISAHSLPHSVPWEELFAKAQTVTSIVKLFLKYLDDLQPFYDNLAIIDEMCCVVLPVEPTTKHNWRMFMLKDGIYLKIAIPDVFVPNSLPTVHIVGPTNEVEIMRRLFSDSVQKWDAELNIHSNLLRVFQLPYFPMLDESNKDEKLCNICYSYDLDGQIPFISCDSTTCHLNFHPSCLQEWFASLTNEKQFLDVSFGACPFCKKKLSPSFAELLNI